MPTDPLVRFSLVVGSLLGGAGASIVVVEKLRRRPLRHSVLSQRWLTWLGLSTMWIVATFSSGARFLILTALATAAALEYARLAGLRDVDRVVNLLLPGAAMALVALTSYSAALIVALLATTVPALVSQDVERGIARICRLLLGVVVAVVPFVTLWSLGAENIELMVGVVFGVALSDVGAFVAGSLFGSHPLAPSLSPQKTREGAIGNLAGAAGGVGLAGMVFPLPPIEAVALAMLVAIGALWGDLFESLLKRSAGVKDAGRILPGFGGALDRLDSLIVAAPLVLGAFIVSGHL